MSGQRGGSTRTKLVRTRQGKGRHECQVGELRLRRKIRRCRLIVPGVTAEHVRDGLGIRAIMASQSHDLISNRLAYADTLGLVWSIRNLRQRLLELAIERVLERRIQGDKHFVRRGGRGRLL